MSPVHPLLALESSDAAAGAGEGQLPRDIDFANRRNDIMWFVTHVESLVLPLLSLWNPHKPL